MVKLLLLALSLALDAMAVSVSVGMAQPEGGLRQAVRLGGWFGAFQLGMPLMGFLLGGLLSHFAADAAPWAACILLAFIGGRMIWEGFQPSRRECDYLDLTPRRLLALSIATSVDALAVGAGCACMELPLIWSCLVIGLVTFGLCVLGAVAGHRLGRLFRTWAQGVGGLVLLVIGVKFLLESL